jgi:hypothetical protein
MDELNVLFAYFQLHQSPDEQIPPNVAKKFKEIFDNIKNKIGKTEVKIKVHINSY